MKGSTSGERGNKRKLRGTGKGVPGARRCQEKRDNDEVKCGKKSKSERRANEGGAARQG